jgi:hypothetical protein
MPKAVRLERSLILAISCEGERLSVQVEKRMDSRPMHRNRKRLWRHKRLSYGVLVGTVILLSLISIPNHNIEPDDVAFDWQDQHSETFQEFKARQDMEKSIQNSKAAMYQAILKYKEKKRLKRSRK